MLIAPAASYGAAVVTLTSPVDKPTMVRALPEEFYSADTTPFDHTAVSHTVGGKFQTNFGDASSHLALNVTEQEIRSTFGGDYVVWLREPGSSSAYFFAKFSLDIVVDTLTPFLFSTETSGTENKFGGSGGLGPAYSEVRYHFYTPNANELDFSFGTKVGVTPFGWPIFDFAPPRGEITGVLLPGETYRLDFDARGGGYTSVGERAPNGASATGSAVLVIPEPASVPLLFVGGALYQGIRRRR